jgi:4-amino-4-deoxy-L-arabinose transferase-like glycosyltransferase
LLYPIPWVFVALGGLGAWSLWRRQRAVAAVFAGPFLLTLGAAIAHFYPFADRLILFLIPTALLSVSEGIGAVVEVARQRVGRPGILAAALALPGLFPVADVLPPYVAENIKPVLSALRDRRRVGDSVYVYYGAESATQFYAKQYDLRPSDYEVGTCHRGQPRQYLQELDAYRGRSRVWVVVSHALPLYGERQVILAYLDTIGVRKETLVAKSRGPRGFIPDTADLYLFDLSDPQRSSKASSLTFPLQVVPLDERFGCY